MASKVQIANFALAMELGKDQITALTDNTKAARLVNLGFDSTAKEVMTLGEFSSATFRQTLAQDATAPDWGYLYRYTLPTNPRFLGMLEINELRPGDYPHTIEAGYLMTDEGTVKIRYKGFQTDTESWDPMLERAVTLRLASRLCYSLTGNLKLKESLLNEFFSFLDLAVGIDGLNSTHNDQLFLPDLKDVRI